MIPAPLLRIFETCDYDDFDLGINSITFDETGFRFHLAVRTFNQPKEEEIEAAWRVEVIGHRENRITFDLSDNLCIENDHSLLWKYTDVQADLYFTGICSDPARLFYRLYHEHYKLFQTYIPFGTFLNMQDFERFFQISGGLVAKGPKKLLIRYAKLLEEAGLEWSIASERTTADWDRGGRRPKEETLKIFLMGQTDTYIIAEDFQFTLL